eukprot:IDg20214t1
MYTCLRKGLRSRSPASRLADGRMLADVELLRVSQRRRVPQAHASRVVRLPTVLHLRPCGVRRLMRFLPTAMPSAHAWARCSSEGRRSYVVSGDDERRRDNGHGGGPDKKKQGDEAEPGYGISLKPSVGSAREQGDVSASKAQALGLGCASMKAL